MTSLKGKKLYRSRKSRIIAGVCGGLAEYFGVDPIIFRILFVLIAIADGIGIFLYFVAAILLPEAPLEGGAGSMQPPHSRSGEKVYDFVAKEGADGKTFVSAQPSTDFKQWFQGRNTAFFLLLGIAVMYFLARRNESFPSFEYADFRSILPLILILVFAGLLWKRRQA